MLASSEGRAVERDFIPEVNATLHPFAANRALF